MLKKKKTPSFTTKAYVDRVLAALVITGEEYLKIGGDGYYVALEEIKGDVEGRMEIELDNGGGGVVPRTKPRAALKKKRRGDR